MAAIDIGAAAIDRATFADAGSTRISKDNPSNDTGTLTTFEIWAVSGFSLTGTKVGTFSGSGTDYTSRDFETIGNVTSGSKQIFSGLDCDVVTGDFVGIYVGTGQLEKDGSGFADLKFKVGDQFGTGLQTYGNNSGDAQSVYGIGETPVVPAGGGSSAALMVAEGII